MAKLHDYLFALNAKNQGPFFASSDLQFNNTKHHVFNLPLLLRCKHSG